MMIIIITGVFSVNNNNEMIHDVTDAPCIGKIITFVSYKLSFPEIAATSNLEFSSEFFMEHTRDLHLTLATPYMHYS